MWQGLKCPLERGNSTGVLGGGRQSRASLLRDGAGATDTFSTGLRRDHTGPMAHVLAVVSVSISVRGSFAF